MKKTIHIPLLIIIGIVVGFIGGRYITIQTTNSSCEAALAKVKSMFPSSQDIRSVSGKISGMNGNTITITANPISPLDSPATMEVVVGETTKIVKSEAKDSATFQKEMEEYQKTVSAQTDKTKIAAPPMPFTEKEIALSDLKVGDQIFAEAGENIKTEVRFTATKIILQATL